MVGRRRVISVLGFAAIGAIGGVAADERIGAVRFGASRLAVAVVANSADAPGRGTSAAGTTPA